MIRTAAGGAIRRYGAFTIGFLLLAAPARAEPTQAEIGAIRAACSSDYRAHCADVPPGGSAALACLRQNLASLSPGCQSAVNATSSAPPSGAAAEAPAAASTAPPATTAAPQPAHESFRHLSFREEFAVIGAECAPDYRALCRGVPPGEGRVVACLHNNAAGLSKGCKAALMEARP
ncbi:conserved hypothetical protein [Methylocella silvestris BL2]|uniref:Cysteine rich repeat protein n=1 Tax=Methylocella silvestris (strain DSM 15510 / CIP 108128 / LMG 27833 / NCIMB 13906 / BL2) TaxID=395965 RepID=B8ENE3_METSB|nr:cysteine rich repeat-containing protein [Methylocella silvestris]ACK50074.1 conserved hypothetical protein [Methylocella silvestris BL2]